MFFIQFEDADLLQSLLCLTLVFSPVFCEFAMWSRILICGVVLLCLTWPACAEKNKEIKGHFFDRDSVGVSESFEQGIPKKCVPVKGSWEIRSGALVGKELKADQHAAVLNYQVPNRDSAVHFSFRLDGESTGFHFSLNHAKGHLFRVVVGLDRVAIKLDRDKKDPASKIMVLADGPAEIRKGAWHTMLVEMKGQEVSVQMDSGLSLQAKHAKLAVDKPNYRFVTRGESLSIDDFNIDHH